MQRFIIILEGEGSGLRKPLLVRRMLVGRSGDADIRINDPKVSSAHLDLRVEPDAVFVQNVSRFGSFLNDKQLTAEVSLNPGDVLKIGNTKLRYEEAPDPEAPPQKPVTADPPSEDLEATKVADSNFMADQEKARQKEESPDEASTRAVVEDGTRIANPSELPGWVRPPDKKEPTTNLWLGILLVAVLAVLGATFWILRSPAKGAEVGSTPFDDPIYFFSISYPANWSKTQDTADVIGFGIGQEGDAAAARVNIYHDKNPEHALTGLSDGFVEYEEVLKKEHFKDFELTGLPKPIQNNDVTMIFFGFHTPTRQGKGIYVLNADMRIVVECSCSPTNFERFNPAFVSILKSFRLTTDKAQQFIEFPLPNAGTQALADSDPAKLAHEFDEHVRRGDGLISSKDVKPDNLYLAMQEYRQALQLAVSSSERLPGFRTAAQGLLQAAALFNQALTEQRFRIKVALKKGDGFRAYWEADKMMQMVPDKTDSAYQEAYKLTRSLERYRK